MAGTRNVIRSPSPRYGHANACRKTTTVIFESLCYLCWDLQDDNHLFFYSTNFWAHSLPCVQLLVRQPCPTAHYNLIRNNWTVSVNWNASFGRLEADLTIEKLSKTKHAVAARKPSPNTLNTSRFVTSGSVSRTQSQYLKVSGIIFS